jgi:hypothetical protein
MSVSRRDFLLKVPVAGTALALMPALAVLPAHVSMSSPALVPAQASTPSTAIRRAPIVSFHLDQPYFDLTGLEKPYVPPAGMRSGAPLAALSDAALSRYYGFI